jgi:hypothetical protein
MIGRFLASTAVAVLMIGTAAAQMSSPPSSNDQGANPPPATIQTQNPGPRGQAQAPAPNDQMNNDQMNQGSTQTQSSKPSMTQRAVQGTKNEYHKAKAALTGDKPASKQSAQGHSKDNIADQLNACEAKTVNSANDRQACIDQATHM